MFLNDVFDRKSSMRRAAGRNDSRGIVSERSVEAAGFSLLVVGMAHRRIRCERGRGAT